MNLSRTSTSWLRGTARAPGVTSMRQLSSSTACASTSGSQVDGGEGHKTLSSSQINRKPSEQRAKYLIIKEVPRTALPNDVLNALRDSRAVDDNFPLSAITSPPASLPRQPSLTKPIHLTFNSHKDAKTVHDHLNGRPLFSFSDSNLNYNYSRRRNTNISQDSFGLNPNSDSDRTSTSGNGGNGGSIQYTESTPKTWMNYIIQKESINLNISAPSSSSSSSHYNNEGQGQGRKSGSEDRERDRGATFNLEWLEKKGMSGRRVLIKGLPGSIPLYQVKRLAKDCGVIDGRDSCIKLPPSKYSLASTYCLTTTSVADAYRLVRKVHMKWYKSSLHGEKFLMRAEVVY